MEGHIIVHIGITVEEKCTLNVYVLTGITEKGKCTLVHSIIFIVKTHKTNIIKKFHRDYIIIIKKFQRDYIIIIKKFHRDYREKKLYV